MEQQIQSERVAYYDNAKFIVVIIIFLGHWTGLPTGLNFPISGINFFYLFNIPLLAMFSGIFAKQLLMSGQQTKYYIDNVQRIFVPFVIFHVIYICFILYYVNGQVDGFWTLNLMTPATITWYLLSFLFWRILLIHFQIMKPFVAIVVAIICSVGIGYVYGAGEFLSLNRTFVYFPFFLIGSYLDKDFYQRLQERSLKIVSFVVLICLLMVSVYFNEQIKWDWLSGHLHYRNQFGELFLYGGVFHLIVFIVQLIACFCVITLLPTQISWYSRYGKDSMNIYLLQGLFLLFISKQFARIDSRFMGILEKHDLMQVVLIFVVTILVSMIIVSKPMTFLAKYLVRPPLFAIFKKK
jgi:fucose 4-O-acetylase-like acetyltransferase